MKLSRWPIGKPALVVTKTGKAFEGVLVKKSGPLLFLRGATLIEHGQRTSMDGEVVIERTNIDFIQA